LLTHARAYFHEKDARVGLSLNWARACRCPPPQPRPRLTYLCQALLSTGSRHKHVSITAGTPRQGAAYQVLLLATCLPVPASAGALPGTAGVLLISAGACWLPAEFIGITRTVGSLDPTPEGICLGVYPTEGKHLLGLGACVYVHPLEVRRIVFQRTKLLQRSVSVLAVSRLCLAN
jgi:hypothetical protein